MTTRTIDPPTTRRQDRRGGALRRSGGGALRRSGAGAVAVAAFALVFGAVLAGTASAHPLGNFTVNRYSGLTVAPDGVAVDYVVDLAEVPTFQERSSVEDAGSHEAYAEQRCAAAAAGLRLDLDGTALPVLVTTSRVSFPPGQGGLATTRLECAMVSAEGARITDGTLHVFDTNHIDRVGWREVTLRGVGIDVGRVLPTESTSARLTDYPQSAVGSVPRIERAEAPLRVTEPSAELGAQPSDAVELAAERPDDAFASLIGRADDGAWAMVVAIGLAAGLGAIHGLAPGHGKTVVAAYLVGTRGTRRQAVGLAGIVALSHTSGVVILGTLTLAASATFPLERVYAWLQLGSAVIVLSLGLWVLSRLLRDHLARGHEDEQPHTHDHAAEPAHPHGHDHSDEDGHDHGHAHQYGRRGLHGSHRHGIFPHRHRVAWDRLDVTRPLRWRALFALGLSGGMLPSASAVIVLLGAVQIGQLRFGGALILAFGAGLAAALVGVGLGVLAASRRANTAFSAAEWGQWLQRWTAPTAAAALLVVGAWLTTRALSVL